MEKKSYPEILHNICIEFGHGEKSRITAFEKAIVLLIDQMMTDEKKKLLQNENHVKNEHYLKNENIKNDCDSCSRHDIIVGCTLKRKNQCMVNEKYTKYRRGHLLPCDRCKTYSVVTKIDRISDNNINNTPRPAIKFICLNCKDYPMINRGVFKGYELRGMEFTEKYLRMCKQKEQQMGKTEQIQDSQKVKPIEKQLKPTKSAESSQDVQHTEPKQDVQQIEPKQDVQQIEPKQDVQHTGPKQDVQHTEPKQDVQHTGPKQDVQHTEPEIEIIAIST